MHAEDPKTAFDFLAQNPWAIPGFVKEKHEGDTVEYKNWAVLDKSKDPTGLDRLAKVICAFANTAPGGLVIFGVDDEKREVLKHTFSEEEENRLHQVLRDKINPPVTKAEFEYKTVPVPELGEVLLLLVRCVPSPPHMVGNVVYVRRGNSAVPAAPSELTLEGKFSLYANGLGESKDPKKREIAEKLHQGQIEQAAQIAATVEHQTVLEHVALLNTRAIDLAEKGQLDQALALFELAVQQAHASGDRDALASAYCNRGTASAWKGDVDAAIADYNSALEINPKLAGAYNNRGAARAQNGDLDAAIADYNMVIQINPKVAGVYCNRGNAELRQGRLDAAIVDYKRALEINPKLAGAYNSRGNARAQEGDLHAAIADFDKALEISPKYANAYNNRGNARAQKGDLDAAITDYSKALEINPEHAAAYNGRGVAYARKGTLSAAIADFDNALQIDPKHAEAYNNRANARALSGNFEDAIEDYYRALGINRRFGAAHYGRAVALFALRRYDDAEKALDQAKEMLPEPVIPALREGMEKWRVIEEDVAGVLERFKHDKRIKGALIFGSAARFWDATDKLLHREVRDVDMIVIVDGFESRQDAVLTVAALKGNTATPMDIQVRDLAVWRKQKEKDLFVKQEVLPKMKVLYGEV